MRIPQLSSKAANALVYLAFSGGEILGARLHAKFRTELIAARLIEVRAGTKRRLTIHLLDAGWDALGEHFPALGPPRSAPKRRPGKKKDGHTPKPTKSKHAKPKRLSESDTLNAVLATLRAYMKTRDLPLAELFAERAHDDEAEVLRAYLSLACDWNEEVRLATLRGLLSGMPRDQLDATLRSLRAKGRLTPYPIENARELRPEDDAAALLLGTTRHHYVRIKES